MSKTDGQDLSGVPVNVQLAAQGASALSEALERRLREIGDEQRANAVFERFSDAFTPHFRVSINVHPEALLSMLQDDRIRYINLHDSLRANMVVDYDPELAAKRRGIDSLAFGSAGEKVTYGAVNLGTHGLVSYGSVCIFLRDSAIQFRTSFLEENSFSYVSGQPPSIKLDLSAALRAVWETVHKLAFVKHFRDIISGKITPARIAGFVLVSTGDKHTDRFIEAQIYPPITSKHFAKITYDPRLYRACGTDRTLNMSANLNRRILKESLLYKRLFASKLETDGIEFEVTGGGAE